MSATKVAVSMDESLLLRLDKLVRTHPFRSRSQVIQEAVAEKIDRMDKSGLARESAKLDRKFEQSLADEGLAGERFPTRLKEQAESKAEAAWRALIRRRRAEIHSGKAKVRPAEEVMRGARSRTSDS